MVDRTVEFFDLFMLYEDLSKVKEIPLEEGYSFRFFDGSDKDIQHWMDIEVSSGDVRNYQEAKEGFETYYRKYINTLLSRCVFLLDKNNIPVGTATAFFIVEPQPGLPEKSKDVEPLPTNVTAHLHWVAIKEEHKGKGLSKALITYTMKQMFWLNHKAAFLHTQTPSWLACKIYLGLGWKPFRFVSTKEDFEKGWHIVNQKINN